MTDRPQPADADASAPSPDGDGADAGVPRHSRAGAGEPGARYAQAPPSTIGRMIDRLAERMPGGSRYELRGEVARGGMGVILRAWDPELRRQLAMKVALGGAARDREGGSSIDDKLLGRFLEEAQVTAQLDHPGVVPVHELGLDDRGQVFFTMRLIEGQDLGQVLEDFFAGRVREADGIEWTLTRLVGVLLKVSEAMAYAHSKGVIHRDLKPANIMVGRFGQVYVMDWGLARVLGEEGARRAAEPEASEGAPSERGERAGSTHATAPREMASEDQAGTAAKSAQGAAEADRAEGAGGADARATAEQASAESSGDESRAPSISTVRLDASVSTVRSDSHAGRATGETSVTTDRRSGESSGSTPALLTMVGDVLGTPAYMSPEQAAGKHDELGPASDVYALGAILYHLLGGRMPYCLPGEQRDAASVWTAVREGPPPALEQIASQQPEELIAICNMAMARAPEARYASMRELGDDLRAYLEGRVVRAHRTGPLIEARKWILRNKPLAITGAIAIVATIGGLGSAIAVQLRAKTRLEAQNDRLIEAGQRLTEARDEADLQRALVRSERDALEQSQGETERALEAARRTAYVGSITAAALNLEAGALPEVKRRLDSCPEDLRGWEWGHYALSLNTALQVYGDQAGATMSLFSARGERVHSAGLDGFVRTWDADSGRRLGAFRAHEGAITRLDVDEGSGRILTTGSDGRWRLFEDEAGTPLRVVEAHSSGVLWGAFLADGARVLTIGQNGGVALWDADSGEELASAKVPNINGATNRLSGIGLDRARGRLYVAAITGFTHTLSLPELEIIETRSHGALLGGLALDEATGRIVLAKVSGELLLFEPEREDPVLTIQTDLPMVRRIAFSPDGSVLIACAGDTPLHAWSAIDGRELGVLGRLGEGIADVTYRDDGEAILVTGRHDRGVRLWDTASVEYSIAFGRPDSPPRDLYFLEGDERIASLSIGEESIRLWEASSGHPLGQAFEHERPIMKLALSANRARLATLARDGSVRLWGATNAVELSRIEGLEERVNALAFDPLGRVLAVARRDGSLQLHDASSGRVLGSPLIEGAPIRLLEFLPNGTTLVFADEAGGLGWIDLRTGHRETVDVGEQVVTVLAVSADGRLVASCAHEREVVLWDTSDWSVRAVLTGHEERVGALVFDADGRRLISASEDTTVRVWETEGGNALAILDAHTETVNCLAMSSDGARLVSGGLDNEIRSWESRLEDARAMWRGAALRRKARKELMAGYLRDPDPAAVVATIEKDSGLSDALRRCALLIESRQTAEQRVRLQVEAVWDVVWRQGRTDEAYAGALRLFEAAYASETRGLSHKGHGMTVRALAQYRAGRYEEALQTFDDAERRLRSEWPTDALPSRTELNAIHRLGRIMALARLGRMEEARTQLSALAMPGRNQGLALRSLRVEASGLVE